MHWEAEAMDESYDDEEIILEKMIAYQSARSSALSKLREAIKSLDTQCVYTTGIVLITDTSVIHYYTRQHSDMNLLQWVVIWDSLVECTLCGTPYRDCPYNDSDTELIEHYLVHYRLVPIYYMICEFMNEEQFMMRLISDMFAGLSSSEHSLRGLITDLITFPPDSICAFLMKHIQKLPERKPGRIVMPFEEVITHVCRFKKKLIDTMHCMFRPWLIKRY